MKDLIEALQIFLKYGDKHYPFHCEHDVLCVHGYDPDKMSEEDLKRLYEIGFHYQYEDGATDLMVRFEHGGFESYRYGSC